MGLVAYESFSLQRVSRSLNLVLQRWSELELVAYESGRKEKVDEGGAVQNKRMETDLDGEVENEMKKITYYFYIIHSDCSVCFITEDFPYCV